MSDAHLVWNEFRYQRRTFMRDPQAMFFAVGLPLLYVVIFVSLFGNQRIDFVVNSQPGPLKAHTIMLAGFVAIGVISATFFNLAVDLVQERESGILKRFRGTPLPTWTFIAGHVGTATILGAGVASALIALGRFAYGIPVPIGGLPAILLALVVSSASFCCLAFAFTLTVKKAGGAVPLGTGVTLALYFLSGNFFIVEHPPLILRIVGKLFPVQHLNNALLTPLNPNTSGTRIEWIDLLVIAAWGAGALLIAIRSFRWTPSDQR
ncbi:MAG: putative multidrug transporter permease protein [Ilumatobacteraceae bacterium]|nr:putative multidrug transporter permease protein [Ilumatobacteraceae bacterium]